MSTKYKIEFRSSAGADGAIQVTDRDKKPRKTLYGEFYDPPLACAHVRPDTFCCGVRHIGNFGGSDPDAAQALIEHVMEHPSVKGRLCATTIASEQKAWEKAFAAAGFTKDKFRNSNTRRNVTFWYKDKHKKVEV